MGQNDPKTSTAGDVVSHAVEGLECTETRTFSRRSRYHIGSISRGYSISSSMALISSQFSSVTLRISRLLKKGEEDAELLGEEAEYLRSEEEREGVKDGVGKAQRELKG